MADSPRPEDFLACDACGAKPERVSVEDGPDVFRCSDCDIEVDCDVALREARRHYAAEGWMYRRGTVMGSQKRTGMVSLVRYISEEPRKAKFKHGKSLKRLVEHEGKPEKRRAKPKRPKFTFMLPDPPPES